MKAPKDFVGLESTEIVELSKCSEIRAARIIMKAVEQKFEAQLKDLLDEAKIATLSDKQQNLKLGFLQALKWVRSLPDKAEALIRNADNEEQERWV